MQVVLGESFDIQFNVCIWPIRIVWPVAVEFGFNIGQPPLDMCSPRPKPGNQATKQGSCSQKPNHYVPREAKRRIEQIN